jgi:hypothetical protein
MTITATVDGMTFATDDSSPHTLAAIDGWYSGPPKRVSVEEYPSSDGASPSDQDYRSARVITQRGSLQAESTEDAITGAWAAFAALQSDGVPSEFSVTDASGTKRVLASVVTNDIVPGIFGRAEYVLQLVARDPVKYGAARVVSTGLSSGGGGLVYPLHSPSGALSYGSNGNLGRVTLTNSGTAAVWPSLHITGGLTAGFFVQRLDTGQVVRYDRVVPDGSTVGVDFRTGAVLVDGVSDGSTYLTGYDFFHVAPGASVDVQFNAIAGSSGTPMAAFTISDGYW